MPQYPNLGKRARARATREKGMVGDANDLEAAIEDRLGPNYQERVPEAVMPFVRTVFLTHKATFGHFPTKEEWEAVVTKIVERKGSE